MKKINPKIGLIVGLIALIGLFLSDDFSISRFFKPKNQLVQDAKPDRNQVTATKSARGPSSIPRPEPSKTSNLLNSNSIPPELVSAMIDKHSSLRPRTPAPRGSSFLNFVNKRLRDPSQTQLEKKVRIESRTFRTLPGVFALPKDQLPDNLDQDSQILKFNRYVIFRSEAGAPPPNSLPVIYNSKTGTLALVTGNLTVVFRGAPTIQPFTDSGLSLIQSFPQVRIATFTAKTKDISQLNQMIADLKQIPNIADISIELTETDRAPN
jgi:hypothetical protein